MKVCMVAYSHYSTDARIKAYVRIIEKRGGCVDILALKEPNGQEGAGAGATRIFPVMGKYQGSSAFSYIASYLLFFLLVFIRLSILQVRVRYDAVHVHNMPNFIIFAAVIPRLLGARCILDMHDLMPVLYAAKFNVSEKSMLYRTLMVEQNLSIRFASHVICADHLQFAYLHNECGAPEATTSVIMNLPYPDLFKPVPKAGKQNSGPLRLVYHGTIAERLGIDILLRAVALVKDTVPVHLSVYGTGDYLEKAVALRDDLGLKNQVYFSGASFPVEQVPEIVSSMDIGVVPNRKNPATDRFMLPVKLMEYVYLQVPVIAPRLKIIQRYFDETMIKFFEPENIGDLAKCIVELSRGRRERGVYAERANAFFMKHSWELQEKTYVGLLH